MPPRYDVVLFDLDDTLSHFDDAPAPDEIAALIAPRLEVLITSWNKRPSISYEALDLALIAGYRASDTAADELHGYRHPDRIESIIGTLATCGVAASRQQAQQVRDTLNFDIRILRPRLFEGVLETIAALSAGGTRLATVTNRSHTADQIANELRYHGLASHFDAVITAGDVGWLKPHPAIVHAALEALDVRPERAIMVGDTPHRDIAAANTAGVTSVLITHSGRTSPAPAAPHEQPDYTIFGDLGSTDGPNGSSFSINLSGLPALIYFVLFFAYFIGMEVAMQATVGKLLAGTRVTNRDGGVATPAAIVGRSLLRIIDGLPFLYLVAVITVAVTPKNQRIGDLASGTIVVRR